MRIYILNYCNVCIKYSKETPLSCQLGKRRDSHVITQIHVHQESHSKSMGFRLVYFTLSIIFTKTSDQVETIFFCSLQNALSDKKCLSENQTKHLWKTSRKQLIFFFRGVNKFIDKWQEGIQNNDEYTSVIHLIHC